MPAPPERYKPERLGNSLNVSQYSLTELQASPSLYRSLLQSYCDVFKASPWNEEWTSDEVDEIIKLELGKDGKVTLATRENRVLGFFWGREGQREEIVPLVINTYFAREADSEGREKFPPQTRDDIIAKIDEKLRVGQYPDLLFCALEMGVIPELNKTFMGARVAYQIVKKFINEQIEHGNTDWIFTLTSEKSAVYNIFTKSYRRAETIWRSNEENGSSSSLTNESTKPFIFMIKNMREFFGGKIDIPPR